MCVSAFLKLIPYCWYNANYCEELAIVVLPMTAPTKLAALKTRGLVIVNKWTTWQKAVFMS